MNRLPSAPACLGAVGLLALFATACGSSDDDPRRVAGAER